MTTPSLASYLRTHRLKSGMSQRELAEIIGVIARHQISMHERSEAVPSLIVALSYQAIFSIPVSELFPDLFGTIVANIEERLAEMEKVLQDSKAKGLTAQRIAHKLVWLWERRNPEGDDRRK